MKQDKFLIGIVIAVVLLITAALISFFAKQGNIPEYQTEDQPMGVVHNYILALYNADFEKAYSYVELVDGKPSFSQFQQGILSVSQGNETQSVEIVDQTIIGDSATVRIHSMHGGGGIFNDGWSNTEIGTLKKTQDGWKIISMPYSFWSYDWSIPQIK